MHNLNRRAFVQGLANLGVASRLRDAEAQEQGGGHPNIIYIHSHDSGRYLGPYGYAVPTPNLNRLAKQGVLFRQAFSAAPTCSPSRACLLTGQYAHQNGMLGLAHLGFSLNNYSRHIIHTLKPGGYVSILAGLQHIAARSETIGYDIVLKPKTMRAEDVAPGAVEYLKSRPKQPFFLDVGFHETHRVFPAPTAKDDPNYISPPATMPDTPETRLDMAGYHASARAMDEGIGQVLDALDQYGYTQNSLVISTTDHGIAFPAMKCSLTDSGCGVSLILRAPQIIRAATVCNALVTNLDLYPTICELAAVGKPAWVEGKSLLPLLHRQTEQIHDAIFAEVNFHASYEPKRAVRTARWKYIRRYDGRATPVLPNCDDGGSKQLWLDNGWKSEHLEHREELFDLVFDPAERTNLIDVPEHQQTLLELRKKLDGWMQKTDDPLLKGPLVAPHGAKLTPVDDISPGQHWVIS